jgi:tRNA modification GTPase
VATAPGRGAVAIVRLSGPDALAIAQGVGVTGELTPRRATRATLRAPRTIAAAAAAQSAEGGASAQGEVIDDALVTWFPAPHSATGEAVVEFSVHGGSYVSGILMAALMTCGARPAMAGEFTERAVRHGKLDLLQAEAVADVIDARSRATHRQAMRQLSGALSRRLLALREALIEVDALIAYEIDFPEEDDGPQPRARVLAAVDGVIAALGALGATLPAAELARDGVTVVLAGAPNAGKSSLLNALVGDARAIVSEVPGTTRDAIEVVIDADPLPWRLVDTAGLRESDDAVERLGLEVSARWLARAQVVLVCGENGAALRAAAVAVGDGGPGRRVLVRTKADLTAADTGARADDATHVRPTARAIAVSAHTGEGLDALREAIAAAVRETYPEPSEDQPVVTRARHAAAILAARTEVEAFREAWEHDALPAPVVATHLRAAIHALDELTGAIDIEDVLERVFRTFCIGK